MLSEEIVLAKGNGQTLKDHRFECLEKLNQFRLSLGSGTEEFLRYFGINTDEFWQQIAFLVSNHDFGKLNTRFQKKIWDVYSNSGKELHGVPKDVPHNFISILYFTNSRLWNLLGSDRVNLCAIAAMHHHGSLVMPEKRLFDRQNEIILQGLDEYVGFDDGLDSLRPSQNGLNELKLPIKTSLLRSFYFDFLLTEVNDYDLMIKRRWVFPLLKQYLHLSDWSASGANMGITSIVNPWTMVEGVLKKKKSSATILRKNVQEAVSGLGTKAILLAPTGSGKTEAAIRWASLQKKQRALFSLPTRALVDDIYYRFQGDENTEGYFPNVTGILHGASDYTVRSNDTEDPDSHEFDRYFHRPVMVTTIDQILFSLFNIGRWDAVNFSLAHGSLIIDEIHSYDKVTLSLVAELIKQTRTFKMPILMMTATLPSWFPGAISAISDETFDIARVSGLKQKAPWKINRMEKIDLDTIGKMGKDNNILIVVNNVKECIDLYGILKEMGTNVRCLHSRFLQFDRREIIRWAKSLGPKGRILVSTQVVEAGMDIDYDVLVTEISPVDSIIQRAGRVNRIRDPDRNSEIFVFEPLGNNLEISELIYGKPHLDRTREILERLNADDLSIQKSLDYVYPANEENDDLIRTYDKIHQLVVECESFGGNGDGRKHGDGLHSLPIREADLPIKTRESKYVSIDVVPVEFLKEAMSSNWREYTLRLPLKSFARYIDFKGRFPVVNLRYSRDTGLQQPEGAEDRDAFFI
ncbi:MAG: CRISPR-associated helicase Cas3' [Thermoplasmataceae archaeon]|jgi:CRISPR-associated endonuclease/helicase Cas3|nr:MAG: CRISPR-associated helicase Cas3' [Cuniculiplasma divulgatum]